jgi:hypothetical protein
MTCIPKSRLPETAFYSHSDGEFDVYNYFNFPLYVKKEKNNNTKIFPPEIRERFNSNLLSTPAPKSMYCDSYRIKENNYKNQLKSIKNLLKLSSQIELPYEYGDVIKLKMTPIDEDIIKIY